MTLNAYGKVKRSLRYWLLRRLPSCKQTVRVMSESLERKLTLRERINVKLHLWVCLWCVWYIEQLKLVRTTVRARAEDLESPALPSLSPEARARIKLALNDRRDQ